MKKLNSILKQYAIALEIFITAFASLLFFGIPINLQTGIACIMIWTAMYMYTKFPIQDQNSTNQNVPHVEYTKLKEPENV